MKKKIIAIGLCGALIGTQIKAVPTGPPPKDSEIHFLFVCIMGAAAAVGGYVVYKVRSCRPKYYCLKDADGNRFVSNATRTERALNEWEIVGGPYRDAAEAAAGCNTNTVQVAVNVPLVTMRIMSSSNLVDWQQAAVIQDDPDHFEWSVTNSASVPAMFYKIQ